MKMSGFVILTGVLALTVFPSSLAILDDIDHANPSDQVTQADQVNQIDRVKEVYEDNQVDQAGKLNLVDHVALTDKLHIDIASEMKNPPEVTSKVSTSLSISASCSGQCGVRKPWPCSCHPVCLVYRSCCEDFHQTCPDIYRRSKIKYSKVMSAEVTCSSLGGKLKTSIFMVSSCPIFDSSEGRDMGIVKEPAAALRHVVGHKSISEANSRAFSTKRLSSELAHLPVTSDDTGIVYINKNVFTCNAAKEEKPNKWRLVSKAKQGVWSAQDLLGALDFNDVYYIPQKTLGKELDTVGFPCNQDSIGSCPQQWVTDKYGWREKCSSFISYVQNSYNQTKQYRDVYNNIYCFRCHHGMDAPGQIVQLVYGKNRQHTGFRLGVVFEQSEDGSGLTVRPTKSDMSMSWTEGVCDMNKVSEIMSCKFNKCGKGFRLRSGASCASPILMILVLRSSDLTIDIDQKRTFGKTVRCLLTSEFGIDVDEGGSQARMREMLDFDTGEIVYVLPVYYFSEQWSWMLLWKKHARSMHRYVSIIMQAMERSSSKIELRRGGGQSMNDTGSGVFGNRDILPKIDLYRRAGENVSLERVKTKFYDVTPRHDTSRLTCLYMKHTSYGARLEDINFRDRSTAVSCYEMPGFVEDEAIVDKALKGSCFNIAPQSGHPHWASWTELAPWIVMFSLMFCRQ